MANDNTFIYRAQNGDEGAFTDLMREYYPFVYTVVIRIVDNPHDVEEVVQDTFLNAYRGLAQLEMRKNSKAGWQRSREIVHYSGSENGGSTLYPLTRWAKGYCRRRIHLMSD